MNSLAIILVISAAFVHAFWNLHAVAALLIPPVILDWASSITRMLVLGPYAIRRWDEVKHQWRINRKLAFGVAVFNHLNFGNKRKGEA